MQFGRLQLNFTHPSRSCNFDVFEKLNIVHAFFAIALKTILLPIQKSDVFWLNLLILYIQVVRTDSYGRCFF